MGSPSAEPNWPKGHVADRSAGAVGVAGAVWAATDICRDSPADSPTVAGAATRRTPGIAAVVLTRDVLSLVAVHLLHWFGCVVLQISSPSQHHIEAPSCKELTDVAQYLG